MNIDILNLFKTDPDFGLAIFSMTQWGITGGIALWMIIWRRNKEKTEGPPWSLVHKNGEYWELTRLHNVQAKITQMKIGMCDAPYVMNSAGFPAGLWIGVTQSC